MTDIEVLSFIGLTVLCSAWLWLFTEKHCLQKNTTLHISQLENNLSKIQALVGITSHEIRAPLTAILATLEKINHLTILTINDKQLIEGAQSLGQAMLQLLNQLAESRHGLNIEMTVRPHPTDLKQLLHDCFKSFSAAALQKNIKPSVHICQEIADSLWIDTLRLQQILSNLLNNAIKFTNHGHIHLSATVIANDYFGQFIEFSIADTGHGILNEPKSHSQTQPSTHIGLLLSRQLIELMNGELVMDSHPDLGSTVSFRVAFRRSVLNPENTRSPKTREPDTLILDDHQATGLQVSAQLKELGIESLPCNNIQEATTLLNQYSIERLIIDFSLGSDCGIALAKQVRNKFHRRLKIYGYTADSRAVMKLLDDNTPFDDILIKPTTTNHWHETLFRAKKYQSVLSTVSQGNFQTERVICAELLKQQLETLESLSRNHDLNKSDCCKHVHKTMGGATITQDHVLHQLCETFLKSDAASFKSNAIELSLCLARSNQVLNALIDNTIES